MKVKLIAILIVLVINAVVLPICLQPKEEKIPTPTSLIATETDPIVTKVNIIHHQEEPKVKEETSKPKVKKTKNAVKKKKVLLVTKTSVNVGTQVWKALKAQGFSDCAAAGILGNMMREVGGDTLNLDWDNNTGCGFGLCQWTSGRRTAILKKYGAPTILEQVRFLTDELKGTNGIRRQVSESQYLQIKNAQTPEAAALAFAKYFERCSSKGYYKRERNARKVYDSYSGSF